MTCDIPETWELRALRDCGEWLSGGTPTKSRAAYWGGDLPWVGPKDLHTRYVDDAEEQLTELGGQSGTRTVDPGTILVVVRSMALANGLQIALTRRRVAFNQDVKAIVPSSDVDPEFLFHALWGLAPTIHGLVDEASHGTKRLRTEVLGSVKVPLPPLTEQRRIARTVQSLDAKIESNRRLAALLEETAAALFRARFVDFVGATDLVDSEIGRIPAGWTCGGLLNIARFVNGKAFTKDANGEGRPILRIRELNSGLNEATPSSDSAAADDHLARHHDILFAWSGSLGIYRWAGPETLINQHIFKVLPINGYPAWFVAAWVGEHLPEFKRIAADKATTMGHIKREHLAEARIALPPASFLETWDATLRPLDENVGALTAESGTLAEIRDTLLPKLISGAIRVPDTADPDEVIGPAAEALEG